MRERYYMGVEIRGRPFGSFVHLLLGGLFIFINGITSKVGLSAFGWPFFELSVKFVTPTRLISQIGIACGLLVMASAILTLTPEKEVHRIGGALGLVFSIIGLTSGGGWMLGSVLAIIGSLSIIRRYPLIEEEKESLPILGLFHWLLGGAFIFINGYVWSLDQSKAHFVWSASIWATPTHLPLAVWGMSCGVLVIVGAILSLMPREDLRNAGVVLGLICSLVSLASSGGWMLGFVLAIVGCLLRVIGK